MDLRPYLEELERFADGELSADEQEAFEHRLEQEPALADAHAAFEQLTADLRWAAGHDTLRHRLATLDQRMNQRQTAMTRMQLRLRRQQRRWVLRVALGIIALVLTGVGIWWGRHHTASHSGDWEAYYQPDPGPRITPALVRSRPLFGEALQQYQSGHYPAALHSLGRISAASVGLDTLQYLQGLILLRQGQGVGAQPYLRRLAEGGTGELARRARYHLGMAYWQAQEPAKALEIIRIVAIDSLNPYAPSARIVLAERALEVQ